MQDGLLINLDKWKDLSDEYEVRMNKEKKAFESNLVVPVDKKKRS